MKELHRLATYEAALYVTMFVIGLGLLTSLTIALL